MTDYATTPDKSSHTRPTYCPLGTDTEGSHHVYRTDDETVHVVHPEDGRTHVETIGTRPVDDWMAYVDARRGWTNRTYGQGLAEMLVDSLEVTPA